jgi:CheY-like chemotaxis protein
MPMTEPTKNLTILMADDDPDDFFLARDAFKETGQVSDFLLVVDGEELMDYLYRRGKFTSLENSPLPSLILLDLNMPRKNGREVLAEIKQDPVLHRIPVVVFTTSTDETDILYCQRLGASCYFTKPSTFEELVNMMKTLVEYMLGKH